jgi:hypothetical protein
MGYFESIVDECESCVLGCSLCDNKATCSECDAAGHWILNKDTITCDCSQGYLQVLNQCTACSKLMEGCSICTEEHVCAACSGGYDLDADTKHCVKQPEDDGLSAGIIILIAVSVLVGIAVVGYIIMRVLRRKKDRKMQTVIETEGEN